MTPVIPSLTIDGWDTTPSTQMNKLFEYYQASDYSQSNTFRGKIVSLKYTLNRDIRPLVLAENIKADLNILYGCYFDTVEPDVSTKDEGNGIVNIVINMTCIKDNETYHLARTLKGNKAGIIQYETNLKEKYRYDQEF